MSGKLTVNQRLGAERELIRMTLDLPELEALAAQSQRLVDDALARARAKLGIGALVVDVRAASASESVVDVEVKEPSGDSGEAAETNSD